MESVVLVIHLILALAIIALVLLQRSEGGGLGIGGGGGGGLGGLASARGTANALTKMTGICAAGFFVTSLTLAVLAGGHSRSDIGILEDVDASEIQAPIAVDDLDSAPSIIYTPPADIPDLDVQSEDTAQPIENKPESSQPAE